MAKIQYDDKVALNDRQEIAEINKGTADNFNEIKTSVNKNVDDIAAVSQGTGASYETRALAIATGGADNVPFVVYNETGFNGQYRFLAADPSGYVLIYLFIAVTDTVTEGSTDVFTSDGAFISVYKDNIPFVRKNRIDTRPSAVQGGLYLNFAGNIEAVDSTIAASEYVKLKPSTTYTLSGALNGWRGVLFTASGDVTGGNLVTFTDVTGGKKFTTGTSKLYFSTNLTVTVGGGDIVTGHVQLEVGEVVTEDEVYIDDINSFVLKQSQVAQDLETPLESTVISTKGVKYDAYDINIPFERENVIDVRPSAIQGGLYLNFAGNIEATVSALAVNVFKKLKPSTTYTLSGAVDVNWRARLFTNITDTTGGDAVTFTDVVGGKKFTTGATKLYFGVNLTMTSGGSDVVAGHVQLEIGEEVTEEKPYILNTNELFVRKTTKQLSEIVSAPSYLDANEQLPILYNKLKKRDSDLAVVVWGSSLSVRETNNTAYDNPQKRPPLCGSRNWASRVWDKVKFGYELFYRFDANGLDDNPRFTEVGSFVTVVPNIFNNPSQGIDNTIWDDFSHREGITRMFSGAGTASITIDIEHTSFDKEGCCDFIYRTDTNGSTVNTITVAEGNGRAVVVEEDGVPVADVELNGYTFSMRHGGVEAYKGNTKFNSKIKIKFVTDTIDSRNLAKTITITKTDVADTRFMYWGIQTSRQRYMASVVSTGRGGQDFITMTPFTDDDIFGHNPDLLISEIPINGGINTPNNTQLPQYYVDQVDDWFFDLTNARSIKSKSNSWVDFNLLIWTPGTTEDVFNAFDDNFKTYMLTDLNFYGVNDNWNQISLLLRDKKESGVMSINTFEAFMNEAIALYGEKKEGFTQSSITSKDSFVGDTIHYNDFGLDILQKYIPIK